MNLSLPFAALLVLLGVGLAVWHARSWRAAQWQTLAERERRFAGRQFRRRTQASLLIALVGAAIAGAEWIASPAARLIVWMLALLAVLWILALAAADAFASRQFFGAEQSAQDAEISLLARQLHEHKQDPPHASRPSDGRSPGGGAGSG